MVMDSKYNPLKATITINPLEDSDLDILLLKFCFLYIKLMTWTVTISVK